MKLLMKNLIFLLTYVSFNQCFQTVFRSKLLVYKLFSDPMFLGVGSMGVWVGLKVKRKKRVEKPIG